MKSRGAIPFLFVLIIFTNSLLSVSCKKGSSCLFKERGTVTHDGCSFIIELDSGEKIEPTGNSNFEFSDGQKVKLSYKEDSGALTVCGFQKRVKIKCIKEI